MVVANIFGTDGIYVLIIAVVVIFGGSQLPKLARNLGLAGKEFRKAHDEAEKEQSSSTPTAPPAVGPGPAAQPTAAQPTAAQPTAAQPAAAQPTDAQPAPGGQDDRVTLSKSELDALLSEREARAKRETSS